MGTIVLPPQDCLSSPDSQQNHYFQSVRPEAGSSCSPALMVPSPAAQDCARLDYSCGCSPGDGLLPIPQHHGQVRAFSKRSPPSKSSSPFCTPSSRKMASTSPSKPNISRSASAILPTPLVGSSPLAEEDRLHLLKGRLPFKIVQGNGPGNSAEFAQGNKSKKSIDARNSTRNKVTATSGHAPSVRAKDHLDGHQGLRSGFKKSHDGAGSKGQPKEADMRKQKNLERSHSAKGARDGSQQVEVPVITILQRPKNKEAAAELFAKFFQENAEQEVIDVNDEWEGISDILRKSSEMAMESETEQQSIAEGLSDFEASEVSQCQTTSIPYIDRTLTGVLGMIVDKEGDRCLLTDAVCPTVSSTLVAQSDVEPLRALKETVKELEFGSEDLAPWERWAGPSYINSPPPSALPLPRFSRKHIKIESLTIAEQFEEIVSDQIATKPSSMSALFTGLSGLRESGFGLDAVATATNELRRILNLDLCRM
eukprot:c24436_g1_i1 orf=701-2143(+)